MTRVLDRLMMALLALLVAPALAAADRLSFQGRIADGESAADGIFDIEIRYFPAPVGGSQIGLTQSFVAEPVDDGRFTLMIAPPAMQPAWIDVAIRRSGTGTYVALSPRGELKPVTRARSAQIAAVAENVAPGSIVSASVAPSSLTASDIDSAQVQRRVASPCASATAVQSVTVGGAVNCLGSLRGPQGDPGTTTRPNPVHLCSSGPTPNDCTCTRKLVDIQIIDMDASCRVVVVDGGCTVRRQFSSDRGGRCCVCAP